ncbi:MAG: NAD(P)/FAD-dependent oxidoreductase [Peptococcaceae bacterium]|jgi:phytoene dehydrogenase-like protein|nr:NAD(P)/FAD-dependent oxidoreductase [Peptococcaceae bacterium]
MVQSYDGIIIGSGPNGLTLGAYLAKAGLKILILEKRFEIGGGLATEQVTLPGFLINTHAVYMPMVDYAPVFQDLQLERTYDLEFIYPPVIMSMPLADGRSLCLYADPERTARSIARFSEKDAGTYIEMHQRFKWMMDDFLAPATYMPPKPALDAVVELERSEVGRAIDELRLKTPRDIVDDLFENDVVRTLFLYAATMWGLDYDLDGISFLVPLLINRATNYRLCAGGSHHLAHVLYKTVVENGGRALSCATVEKIIIENGRATGVRVEDGTVYEAKKFVASSLDPHQTFLRLAGEENLDPELARRVRDWAWEKYSLFDVHLALSEAPRFKAAELNPDLNNSLMYVVGYESQEQLIDHLDATRRGKLLTDGGFNCCFPSIHDRRQAPPGKHTGRLSQHAPYRLQDGGPEAWYRIREEHALRVINTLTRYAPNITEDVIMWHNMSTPLDIQNKFPNMVEGSIKQGAYLPFQMGYTRPNEYCSQCNTPIPGLYVCGASVYPGGLCLMGPGYLCAEAIVKDLEIKKWWQQPGSISRAIEKGVLYY